MHVFIIFYLTKTAASKFKKFLLPFLLLIVVAVFTTQTKGATLALAVGVLVMVVLYFLSLRQRLSKFAVANSLIAGLVLMGLLVIALGATSGSSFNSFFDRLDSGSRLIVWQEAWQGFLERPLLGWGWGNFQIVFERYFNPCLIAERCGGNIDFDRAHNIVFETCI